MSPRISIIISSFNGEKYISNAIESVLKQSFVDFELLIINDGSKDKTESIIKKYKYIDKRIIYLKNDTNLGVVESLNRGLSNSKGEYIARIDDDDEWIDKDKLKKQVEFFDKNNDYVLIGTGVVVVGENNEEISRYLLPSSDMAIRDKMLRINCFIHSSVLFKRREVLSIHGYSGILEDYDLWLRLGTIGKMTNLEEFSVLYRFKDNSVNTNNKIIRLKENLDLAKKYKKYYPNYYKVFFLGYLKIFLYPLFKILPIKYKGFFLKLHKSF